MKTTALLEFKIDEKGIGTTTVKGDILALGEMVMITMLKNEPLAEIIKAVVRGYDIIKQQEKAEKVKAETKKIILP